VQEAEALLAPHVGGFAQARTHRTRREGVDEIQQLLDLGLAR
jgi:hypothetical protein